jgi:hypothetical protein
LLLDIVIDWLLLDYVIDWSLLDRLVATGSLEICLIDHLVTWNVIDRSLNHLKLDWLIIEIQWIDWSLNLID